MEPTEEDGCILCKSVVFSELVTDNLQRQQQNEETKTKTKTTTAALPGRKVLVMAKVMMEGWREGREEG